MLMEIPYLGFLFRCYSCSNANTDGVYGADRRSFLARFVSSLLSE